MVFGLIDKLNIFYFGETMFFLITYKITFFEMKAKNTFL